jgi:hypothetical protein
MMKHLSRTVVAIAAFLAVSGTMQAQTVTAINGTPYNTTTISDYSTTGADMNNMQVIVCLSSIGCQTRSWGALDANYNGVQDNGLYRIRVGRTEDTFSGDWRFDLWSENDLQSVTFSGRFGNTVFDRTNPNPGTPGSSDGRDGDLLDQCVAYYSQNNCVNFNSAGIQYRNRVSLNGVFYGDLYESVHLDFANVTLSGPDAGGGFDTDFTTDCRLRVGDNCRAEGFFLRMDTDNARLSTVPEPSTYALMAAGLAAITAVSRRRRRAVPVAAQQRSTPLA